MKTKKPKGDAPETRETIQGYIGLNHDERKRVDDYIRKAMAARDARKPAKQEGKR